MRPFFVSFETSLHSLSQYTQANFCSLDIVFRSSLIVQNGCEFAVIRLYTANLVLQSSLQDIVEIELHEANCFNPFNLINCLLWHCSWP